MKPKAKQSQTMVQFHASFQISLKLVDLTPSSLRSQKKRQELWLMCITAKEEEGNFINHIFLISLLLSLIAALLKPWQKSAYNSPWFVLVWITVLKRISVLLDQHVSVTSFCKRVEDLRLNSHWMLFTSYFFMKENISTLLYELSLCSSHICIYKSKWPRKQKTCLYTLALVNSWRNIYWL